MLFLAERRAQCGQNFLTLSGQIKHITTTHSTFCQLVFAEAPRPATFSPPALRGGLDYCNSLLAGIPQKLINKLQCVMNCAARLVCKVPKREHVTPLLVGLRWLPVERRIEYKIATLRSSADTRIFRSPNRRKRFQGQRAFFCLFLIGPSIWNNLPFSRRHAQTLSAFKSQLKTHLFSISYSY